MKSETPFLPDNYTRPPTAYEAHREERINSWMEKRENEGFKWGEPQSEDITRNK